MKYIKYVPPHIVAKEAREALAKRKETPDELWERLIRIGLIREMDDGTVKVCFSREPDENGEHE